MSHLVLSKSTLPIEGVSGVFTRVRIRKGACAMVADPVFVKGHDLLSSTGGDGVIPRRSSGSIRTGGDSFSQFVAAQPLSRPLVGFSQDRFLALRHTWCSDRHFTMFLPHAQSIDIVAPSSAFELQRRAADEEQSTLAGHSPPKNSFSRKGTAALNLAHSSTASSAKGATTVTNDEILFEVNDPFPCQLPDPDDVANPRYWRGVRKWLEDYSQMASGDRTLLETSCGGTARSTSTAANVQLVKIDSPVSRTGADADMMPSLGLAPQASRYALVALRDIPADSELFLSYGVDWWRQRLLSTLLLSAETPSEMGAVRWIERLCAPRGQEDDSFPLLTVDAVAVRGRNGQNALRSVLWDALRQERASSQSVIAFVVRQSCIDALFASKVMGLFAAGGGVTVMPALRRLVRAYLSENRQQ